MGGGRRQVGVLEGVAAEAAEIRRLRAENERLREALRDIASKLQDAKHGRINRRWDDWIFTIEVALTPEARDGE